MGETCPTVKVKRDGYDYVIINKSDFDPKQHVLVRERLKAVSPTEPSPAAIPDANECVVKHMGAGRYAVLYDNKELPYARSLDRAAAKHFEDMTLADKQAYLLQMRQVPGT